LIYLGKDTPFFFLKEEFTQNKLHYRKRIWETYQTYGWFLSLNMGAASFLRIWLSKKTPESKEDCLKAVVN
jgi:hypothetical protein